MGRKRREAKVCSRGEFKIGKTKEEIYRKTTKREQIRKG